MDHDYGKCHVCGSLIAEQRVDQTLRDGDDWLLVRGVPTGVCTKCGEHVLRWPVLQRLEELTSQRKSVVPTEHIEVPVFAF